MKQYVWIVMYNLRVSGMYLDPYVSSIEKVFATEEQAVAYCKKRCTSNVFTYCYYPTAYDEKSGEVTEWLKIICEEVIWEGENHLA